MREIKYYMHLCSVGLRSISAFLFILKINIPLFKASPVWHSLKMYQSISISFSEQFWFSDPSLRKLSYFNVVAGCVAMSVKARQEI